jgi:von Willebrand factor type A domain
MNLDGDGFLNMLHHRSNFEKRASSAVAFMTSFTIHLVVLIIVASIAFTIGKESHGVMLDADIGNSVEVGFDEVDVVAVESPIELPEVKQLEPMAAPSLANLEVSSTVAMKPTDSGPSLDLALDSSSASGGTGSSNGGSGEAANSLSSTMKKRGAAFFGAYAEGKRFIFVLDSSRSMLQDDRWTYACNQLIDSLNGLQPEQEFYVICFDIETTYLFNIPPSRAKFFKSDEKTLPRVKRWLRTHELGRATMPAQALQNALALEPDAIFLLSDGELQDNSVAMLRTINGFSSAYRQIPIHTVHLFSDEGRETLQLIARENSGTFTPVQNN